MEATEKFIESFVETGDYLVSMREAGFKDKNKQETATSERTTYSRDKEGTSLSLDLYGGCEWLV